MSRWCSAFALVLLLGCAGARPAYAIDVGRYGKVKVVEPDQQARGFVVFFSDRNGLTTATDDAARAIAKAGALVVEVDTPAYLKRLDDSDKKCHRLIGDAELSSRQLQRAHGFTDYLTPIMAGVGEGATLAQIVLTEAPPATIAGVVSFDPSATIASRLPICTAASTEARAGGFSYGVTRKLRGFWTVGLGAGLPKEDRDYVTALRRDNAQLQLREFGPDEAVGDALRTLVEPHLPKPKAAVANVSALPLIILGVGHPSKIMVVVMSGDGGWRDLDKTIAEDLQRSGVPVVGWDSLRYFWSRKTPQQTADDLASVIETFMARWQASEVALVGYSFSADVMPFAYNRLPDSLRSHVALIALLGFAREADFEITLSGWLGEAPGPDAVPVLPETNKIPPRLMQCFYGQNEKDTACPELARRGVEVIRILGGHHFDGDYEALASRILTAFERQVGPLPLLASEGHTAMAIPGGSLSKKHLRVLLLVATMIVLLTLLLLWVARRTSRAGRLRRRS